MRGGALAIPAFRRIWAAGLVSDGGDWVLFVAMPLVVLDLTGSALGTSIAFLLELAPAVAVAPLAARLADRVDRRRLLVLVSLAHALALVPLAVPATARSLPVVYAVIAVESALGALFVPARNALLPELVAAHELTSANALAGAGENLARLVGGPAGGVLLAVGGLPLVVAVDLATFLVSAAVLATLPRGGPPTAASGPARSRMLAALLVPGVRSVLAVDLVASVAQGMFVVLFVLFVTGPLHGGETEVGLLRGVQAVGALVAGAVLAVAGRAGDRPLAAGSIAAFGGLSLLIWNLPLVTTAALPYVVLFALVGAPGVLMATALTSTLQRILPRDRRGSGFAAAGAVAAVGQGVGIAAAGALATPAGVVPLLEVQGCIYLLAAILAVVVWPRTGGGRAAVEPPRPGNATAGTP